MGGIDHDQWTIGTYGIDYAADELLKRRPCVASFFGRSAFECCDSKETFSKFGPWRHCTARQHPREEAPTAGHIKFGSQWQKESTFAEDDTAAARLDENPYNRFGPLCRIADVADHIG